MKKKLCLVLCLWLPLFFSTAGFASANMQINQALLQTAQVAVAPGAILQADNEMPDNCPMDNADSQQDNTSNNCQHCSFCVPLAFYSILNSSNNFLLQHTLSGHIAWATSSYLSPADQRPPITQ